MYCQRFSQKFATPCTGARLVYAQKSIVLATRPPTNSSAAGDRRMIVRLIALSRYAPVTSVTIWFHSRRAMSSEPR